MHTSHWNGIPWLALFVGAVLCATALAQPQPKQEPVVPPPFPDLGVSESENPAVSAILLTRPSTPTEMARAASILADLERPDLAKSFLQRILAAKLSTEQLAALADEFGSAMFVRMASREDLAPEARTLADAVLKAVAQVRRDPQRIAARIKQLSDPSSDVRYRAMNELRESQGAGVAQMVAVLADPARAAEHPNLRVALVRIGRDAVGPLTAMLQADSPRLAAEAARSLALLGARGTLFYLLAPYASPESPPEVRAAAKEALEQLTGATPAPHEAAELLAEHARRHFERQEPVREHSPGQVEIWGWDARTQQPAARLYTTDDAMLALAARFAREAFSIARDDEAIRVLYLATALEQARYAEGLDRPLRQGTHPPMSVAATLGPEVVEDVLRYAVQTGHAPAATAAARLLGDIGRPEPLLFQGTDPSPLVLATRHPDRRLRLAAAESILKLMPVGAFPGSSYLPEALHFFAATGGRPRVLVAGPSTAESRRVGGYLAAMGYEIDTATSGNDLIRAALASPDYELILIDSQLLNPTVDFVLQQIRRDNRTALLPVGVLAREQWTERARHLVRHDPLAMALPRPHSQESVQWQVEQLLALRGRDRVAFAERQRHAALAMELLGMLTADETQHQIFNLQGAEQSALAALYVPQFTAAAVRVLGNLGTAGAQTALVDLASRNVQPLENRQAALDAFSTAVEKNGILLTTDQILRQYERYNQSAALDPASQQVLGSILDCLETPSEPLSASAAEGAALVPQPGAATGP